MSEEWVRAIDLLRDKEQRKWLKETPERPYWLADKEKSEYRGDFSCFLFFIDKKGEVNDIMMYSSDRNRSSSSMELSVRFAAYLPPTTLINVGSRIWDGSTVIRPLQIKLGEPSSDEKLRRPQTNLQKEDLEQALNQLYSMRQEMQQQINEIDSLVNRIEKLSKQ